MKIVTMLNGVISPGAEGVEADNHSDRGIVLNKIRCMEVDLKDNEDMSDVLVIKAKHDVLSVSFYCFAEKNAQTFNKVKISAKTWSKNEIICALKPGGRLKIVEKNSETNMKVKTVWQWDGKLLTSRGKSQIAKSINIAELIEEGELEQA